MSNRGAIDGHVYKLPENTPAAGVGVIAVSGGFFVNRTTQAPDGFFEFNDPQTPNNWGLPLGSVPGPATYYVGVNGAPADTRIPVTIDSNTLAHVDLYQRTSSFEPPPRCSSEADDSPTPSSGASSGTGTTVTPNGPGCTVACPVSVTTGNMDLDQTDAVIPGVGLGLRFSRSYNSHNVATGRFGVFGRGWTHSYEKRLTFPAANVILLRSGNGQPAYFQDSDVNGSYLASAPFTKESWIEKQSATVYVRHFRRGGSERYEVLTAGTASLTALIDAAGNVTTLGYVAGKLTTITDPGGRQLTLAYNGTQLQQLTGPDGPIATFTYIALGGSLGSALNTVTYADGDGDGQLDGSFTFAYHPSPSGRLWTVTDGAGKVLETHVYDASGRVTQAKVSGDVDKYTLDYSQTYKTTVTDSLGNVTTYEWADIWGSRRVTKITGPCASCGGGGGDVQEWTYDDRGRVTSHKDGEGNVTTYEYGG